MILGADYEAAKRQAEGAEALLNKLEDAWHCASKQGGRAELVAYLAKQICALQAEWADAKAVMAAHKRQEDEREALRLGRQYVRQRMGEQLLLHPAGQAL